MNDLRACASCARHVRTDVATCPFCWAVQHEALELGPISTAPPWLPHRGQVFRHARLGVAVGTGLLATSLGSCSASSSPAPAYGAPPTHEVDGPCGEIETGIEGLCPDFNLDR